MFLDDIVQQAACRFGLVYEPGPVDIGRPQLRPDTDAISRRVSTGIIDAAVMSLIRNNTKCRVQYMLVYLELIRVSIPCINYIYRYLEGRDDGYRKSTPRDDLVTIDCAFGHITPAHQKQEWVANGKWHALCPPIGFLGGRKVTSVPNSLCTALARQGEIGTAAFKVLFIKSDPPIPPVPKRPYVPYVDRIAAEKEVDDKKSTSSPSPQ
jgi:hypothetical protein